MNSNESKDLIERVGGLESAQMIINRAPYWLSYYVTEGQHKGQYGSSDGVFADGFFDDTMTPFPPPHIKLSDLRTAITEQRPHPCATCPNVGHKACCQEAV